MTKILSFATIIIYFQISFSDVVSFFCVFRYLNFWGGRWSWIKTSLFKHMSFLCVYDDFCCFRVTRPNFDNVWIIQNQSCAYKVKFFQKWNGSFVWRIWSWIEERAHVILYKLVRLLITMSLNVLLFVV